MARSRLVIIVAVSALVTGTVLPQAAEGAAGIGRAAVRTIHLPARVCTAFAPETCVKTPDRTVTVGVPRPFRNTSQTTMDTCPEEALEGATCGHVETPLEWDAPNNGDEATITTAFELYTHTDEGPAQGVILPNFGGPGGSTTRSRDLALALFGANLATHDLLLIDDRGTGLSDAIDCPEMNVAQTDFQVVWDAMATCGATLGDGADDYSSGDHALDTETVVSGLGYQQVDLYALSYGGMKAIAFAARFPEMVRSIVFDSPVTTTTQDPLAMNGERAKAVVSQVAAYCEASRTCRTRIDDPAAEVTALIERMQASPISGSFDIYGEDVHETASQNRMLSMMINPATFLTFGDLPAAAVAQADGDKRPLVRLIAESKWLQGQEIPNEPTLFSNAASFAIACADQLPPWDWDDPLAQRVADYEAARAALPEGWFGPFTPEATESPWADFFGKPCAGWPMPSDPTPVIPSGSTFPEAPVLVLTGQLDSVIPPAVADDILELFPNSTMQVIPDSFHAVVNFQGGCSLPAINEFYETLVAPDGICQPPFLTMPGVGHFDRSIRQASMQLVSLSPKNEAGKHALRSALVAVRTMMDGFVRGPAGFGNASCLRGGAVTTNFNKFPPVARYDDCRWAPGVKVAGKASWFPTFFGGDGSTSADLAISGSKSVHGTIHVAGRYFGPGSSGRLRVRGEMGGRKVAFSLPST